MNKNIVCSIIALTLMSVCLVANGQEVRSPLPSGPTLKEVVVATINQDTEEEFKLRTNIYLPTTPTTEPAPLVLFIHGHGGAYNFSNGSRSYEFSIALKDRGIAVATIDYRNDGNALENVHEVKAYVRYFRAHAEEYNIDPDRIGIWGTSRGGHLAAMLATSGGVEDVEGDIGDNLDQSSAIQCAVIYYPLTDIFLQPRNRFAPWFLGSKPSDADAIIEAHEKDDTSSPVWKYVEVARLINPINHVSEDDPPALIAVSAKDPITPLSASLPLFQKYVEQGVDASLYTWGRGTHGVVGTDIEAATSEWIANKLLVDLASKE